MKIKDIFSMAIEMGMEADPRGLEGARKVLTAAKKAYDKLPENRRIYFDKDSLSNPYGDSRILNGDPDTDIDTMIVGIDMDLPELLLTRELNRDGAGIGLVMSHHPRGIGLADLAQVKDIQTDSFSQAGIRLNETQEIMEPKIREVEHSVGSSNYQRTVDAARLLGLNMVCIHTPCDNLVNNYLSRMFAAQKPDTLDDIIDLLLKEEEYATAARCHNAPAIAAGSGSRSAGRVFVDMTGGTEGPSRYYSLLAQAGVSTVVCMAVSKEILDAASESHLNVISAGHMASDSLGVNLFLDKVSAGGVTIIPASGLIRVSRN